MASLTAAETPVIRSEFRGAVARLFATPTGEVIISGPAGTGKTRGILDWIHHRCATERLSVLFVRKTQESLKRSALLTYTEQVLHDFDGKQSAADGVTYFGGSAAKPPQFMYHDTGSTIVLGGMDTMSKVLSTEYDLIYVNEATELSQAEWEQLGSRTDRPKVGYHPPSLLLGDCNPSTATHWIRLRAAEGKLQLWPTTHRDNPAMYAFGTWTAAGLRYLARLNQYTGVRRLRFLLGQWVSAEGVVYDGWDDGIHLVEYGRVADRLASAWHVGAVDWGWVNPMVMQVWAVDHDGRVYLVCEIYRTETSMDDWIERCLALSKEFRITDWVADPSEPAYIAQFQAAGLWVRKANNSVLPGITAVQNRLLVQSDGMPRLFVVRGYQRWQDEKLIQSDIKRPFCFEHEVTDYIWLRDKDGQRKDQPVKKNDHAMDCMRYAVASLDLDGVPDELDPAILAAFDGLPT